jgi:large subunit ribosomal protein L21
MYAVIETGGKQYKVSAGETIEVEKLPLKVGQEVELDRVLLVSDKNKVQVGNPTIEGAKIMATVASQGKAKKVIVFKYKPKNRYRRKAGHRQAYTRLRIDKIIV